jgi:DNA-directed RNA polymerase subunit RPC12/RpoP
VNEKSGASPQTARAAERQPSNFEGLETEVIAVDDLVVTRSIACRCGSRTGRVLAGERLAEWGWLDPLTWVCSACERSHVFFDSAQDGYDGRFGHGTSHAQATKQAAISCPECGAQMLEVQCGLVHNIDASELDEALGPDKSKQFSDYFDWLNVNAECASCQRQFPVGDWELA